MKRVVVSGADYLSTFKNYKLGLLSLKKYDKLFPVYGSSALAGIVADITGDGHLGRGLVQFISKDKNNAIRFRNEVAGIFGIDGKIRRSPSNKIVWECLIGGNAFSKILRLCGAPYGEKVMTVFYVPEWIFTGDKNIKKRYIQRLFDCEGSVVFQGQKRIIIKIKLHKSSSLIKNHLEFLNQLRYLLSDFGIKTTNPFVSGYTKRKDGIITIGYEFQLYGTRKNLTSIMNFRKNIDFETKCKRERLIKYLNVLENVKIRL